jgi:SAM-dependent methyltransferase
MSRLSLSATGTELLDDPDADPEVVTRSLRNIARANHWFGGLAAVRYGLARVLKGILPGPVSLLDVGTGMGDIPAMARRWGRRRGWDIRPVGLELHAAAARLAAQQGLPMILGCGGDLPLRPGGVDVVVVSQLAHHLDADGSCALFQECHRVARRGVVIADLHRSRAAGIGFWFGSHLLGFDTVTITDGLTSIRRGFTVPELANLLRRAGISGVVAHRPGARVVATWRATP